MLPFSIAIMVIVWLAGAPITLASAAGLVLALLTTLALRWVSNALQLIRVRSWAVSSVFALLISATAQLHGWSVEMLGLGLIYMVHVTGLIYCLDMARPQVGVFISAVALALMSMVEPLTLWLLVPMLLAMLFALRVLTGRTLTALFLGLLLPYEFRAAYFLHSHGATALIDFVSGGGLEDVFIPAIGELWRAAVIPRSAADWLPLIQPLGCGALLLFSLIANIYFVLTSIDDKLVVRMQHFTLLLQWPVLTALLLVGMPQSVGLIPCVALSSAPLMGRYAVFSRGWGAEAVWWLLVLTLTFLCLCSFIFSA